MCRRVSNLWNFGNRHGVLAQLVERLLCMQKVAGSIPAYSMNTDQIKKEVENKNIREILLRMSEENIEYVLFYRVDMV